MSDIRTAAVNGVRTHATAPAGGRAAGRQSDEQAEWLRRVEEYYVESWIDFRAFWSSPVTRAMHFGYEQPGTRKHDEALLALNHVMAETSGLAVGARVVDAGCGVGGTSIWLAEAYECNVVGVNFLEEQLERARRYARQKNLMKRLSFVRADFADTGLPPGEFDAVWAQESACHAFDKRALAAEWARLLKPGGRVAMADYITNRPHPGLRRWEENWDLVLVDEAEWRTAFEQAGFCDIEFVDLSPKMARSIRRLYRLCKGFRPLGEVMKRVGLRSEEAQRNLYGGIDAWQTLQAGLWRYCLVLARMPGPAR